MRPVGQDMAAHRHRLGAVQVPQPCDAGRRQLRAGGQGERGGGSASSYATSMWRSPPPRQSCQRGGHLLESRPVRSDRASGTRVTRISELTTHLLHEFVAQPLDGAVRSGGGRVCKVRRHEERGDTCAPHPGEDVLVDLLARGEGCRDRGASCCAKSGPATRGRDLRAVPRLRTFMLLSMMSHCASSRLRYLAPPTSQARKKTKSGVGRSVSNQPGSRKSMCRRLRTCECTRNTGSGRSLHGGGAALRHVAHTSTTSYPCARSCRVNSLPKKPPEPSTSTRGAEWVAIAMACSGGGGVASSTVARTAPNTAIAAARRHRGRCSMAGVAAGSGCGAGR